MGRTGCSAVLWLFGLFGRLSARNAATFAGMSTPDLPATPDSLSKAVGLGNLNRSGRKPGSTNRTTQTFRETVQALLDDNRENVALWLKQTAEGSKSRKVGGKLVPGRPPDPAGAARLLAQLAEFAAPKLNRSEVVGEGGGPLTVVIKKEA
jgi:hypothetical protein